MFYSLVPSLYMHSDVCLIPEIRYHQHSINFNFSVIHDRYSELLLRRDRCLSPALEGILRDVILADPSDYGVDLAVGKIFASYQPGTHRWQQLQCPNARWLTCNTEVNVDGQPSQTVHINLLDGALRVDGQPLGGLPRQIRHSSECQQIFRDVCTHCNF